MTIKSTAFTQNIVVWKHNIIRILLLVKMQIVVCPEHLSELV